MIRSVAETVALVIIVCPQIRCQLDLGGCQSASVQFESMLDCFAEVVHERYLAETLLLYVVPDGSSLSSCLIVLF